MKCDSRRSSRNIAAIDFGTKNCSVVYITTDGVREGPQRLPLNTACYRVPTAILFKPDGTIDSFGYEAHAEYLNLNDEERLEFAYFERIKVPCDEVMDELKILL